MVGPEFAAVAADLPAIFTQVLAGFGSASLVSFAHLMAQLTPILATVAAIVLQLAPVSTDFLTVLAQLGPVFLALFLPGGLRHATGLGRHLLLAHLLPGRNGGTALFGKRHVREGCEKGEQHSLAVNTHGKGPFCC
ncbi:MAG: hypothetical protein K0R03_1761 [Moraxellaceae bacterium]|nr:hypothetical protein [Moraxellaceae bacterium]